MSGIVLAVLMAFGGVHDCDHELVKHNNQWAVKVECAEDEYEYHTIAEHIEIHQFFDSIEIYNPNKEVR